MNLLILTFADTPQYDATRSLPLILIIVFIILSKTKLKTFGMAVLGFAIGVGLAAGLGFAFGMTGAIAGHIAGSLGILLSAVLTIGHSLRSKKKEEVKSAGA